MSEVNQSPPVGDPVNRAGASTPLEQQALDEKIETNEEESQISEAVMRLMPGSLIVLLALFAVLFASCD